MLAIRASRAFDGERVICGGRIDVRTGHPLVMVLEDRPTYPPDGGLEIGDVI